MKRRLTDKAQLKSLMTIPGVGPSLARDLVDLGCPDVASLKNRDPEKLYQKLMALRKTHIDRCVLYVFREAVYFASEKNHQAELLKWWNWKDN